MNVLGFLLAGTALLLLAEVQPELAIGTGALVLLGSVVANPQALNSIGMLFSQSTYSGSKNGEMKSS